LTVIYELADNVSEMSADDFLDSVSVSEISYLEEDEMAWAVLGGSNGGSAAPPAAAVVEMDDDVDPWVVLGQDGS